MLCLKTNQTALDVPGSLSRDRSRDQEINFLSIFRSFKSSTTESQEARALSLCFTQGDPLSLQSESVK